ncbi:serine hydrolase domain-containing protein [Xanthomonas sp. MUS 060]|uniref:serine hydrolase domain-containing protein n=1 Tax=Xanthomonas sp. MUS 060 TaxID=1588031 RepID=UPI0005F27C57|nr:serine hydrolase domain-containing protein [Xanthomonas sp. MUS 060]
MTASPFALDAFATGTVLSPRIDAVVQEALEQRRLVGVRVLVAHNGTLIHQQAAGWADRERQRPMTMKTLCRLGSVSKLIVSTAALVLAAQGKLDLDADIVRWLPEFQPHLADGRIARISVRQLLGHTAGLGYRFLETDADGPYTRAGVSDGMDMQIISLEENLRRIASVPLLYEPGTAWGYSLATDILGALIERVHDAPLDESVRQLVTDPLAMHDTGFVVDDPQRMDTVYVNDTPQPHLLAEGEVVPAFEGKLRLSFSPGRIFDARMFLSGGAGMAGSATDFLQLLETLRQDGGTLLPSALIADMQRDHSGGWKMSSAPGFGYGLGYMVLRDRQLAATPESVGTWRWCSAYGHSWFVDPERQLSVLAFSNTIHEGMCGHFVTALRDAVYATLDQPR